MILLRQQNDPIPGQETAIPDELSKGVIEGNQPVKYPTLGLKITHHPPATYLSYMKATGTLVMVYE